MLESITTTSERLDAPTKSNAEPGGGKGDNTNKKMKMEELRSKVGGVVGIPWNILEGNRRTPNVVRGRWVMLYCMRQLFPWMGTQELASNICRDCHGTAIHGMKRATELYETDQEFRQMVDAVLETE